MRQPTAEDLSHEVDVSDVRRGRCLAEPGQGAMFHAFLIAGKRSEGVTMKKVLSAFCVVALAGAAVAAQGAGAPGQEKKPDASSITVTGCVAPGSGADQFQLTNATLGTAPPATEKAGEKPKMGLGATYNLMGGTNLKAHVGHKVEVTGTMAKPDTSAKPATGGTAPAGTINVSNVKMVSASCP